MTVNTKTRNYEHLILYHDGQLTEEPSG